MAVFEPRGKKQRIDLGILLALVATDLTATHGKLGVLHTDSGITRQPAPKWLIVQLWWDVPEASSLVKTRSKTLCQCVFFKGHI